MATLLRFGRAIEELPAEMEFGDWGRLETTAALAAFEDTLAWFDSDDVIKAEADRWAMIKAARMYYDGNHAKPLKVNVGEPDDNVLVNLCRPLVDDSVSWLFGNPETGVLTMKAKEEAAEPAGEPGEGEDLDDEPAPEETAAQEQVRLALEKIYKRSGGFRFFKRMGSRGSIAGHFYVKLIAEAPGPRLVVLDPLLCAVRTDPMDGDRAVAYKVEWRRVETEPNSRRKLTYIYRQLAVEVSDDPSAWVVGDFKAKDRRKREWQLTNAWAWPYAWSPIVDGPNVQPGWGYYGLSDLEDVAGINDGVNFLVSNSMRILKHHGHPKTIGTGISETDLVASGIDNFWTVEEPTAKVYNLEMQSDLGAAMNLLDFLKTSFYSIGRGLDPSVYKDQMGRITNFALRVLAIRAVHKMGDKRMSYGDALVELNRRALEMAGTPEAATLVQWPDPLPEDPKTLVERLEKEIGMEITSRQTAAEETGRSWSVERGRISAEKKESSTLGKELMKAFDGGLNPGGEPDEGDDDVEDQR